VTNHGTIHPAATTRQRATAPVRAALTAVLALLGAGCASETPGPSLDVLKASEPEVAAPHDPNDSIDGATFADGDSPTPIQHSARTTLLEENERLRELLSKSQNDRRMAEQVGTDAQARATSLEGEIASLRDAVARLSEQLEARERQVVELESTTVRLEKERTTLAEMYALEKRQRLSFEKELLEREIRTRTLSKDG
jgi:TolA-binding protein